MTLQEFDTALWKLLREKDTEQYIEHDGLHNGLYSWGANTIKRVGFGVSASKELFEMAAEAKCQAIVVHHGITVDPKTLDRLTYERYATLAKNDISLWGAHYLLDAHSTLGNNAQILKQLGITKKERYFDFSGGPWGFIGTLNKATTVDAVLESLEGRISASPTVYTFGPKKIKRIAVVTGSGGPDSASAAKLRDHNIDLYIFGDAREWHRELFREAKVNAIAGGHYYTETFGVEALQEYVEVHWDVETTWLDLENEL